MKIKFTKCLPMRKKKMLYCELFLKHLTLKNEQWGDPNRLDTLLTKSS